MIIEKDIKYGDQYKLANGSIAYFFKSDGPSFTESFNYQFLIPKFGIVKYNSMGTLLYPYNIDDTQYNNKELQIVKKL